MKTNRANRPARARLAKSAAFLLPWSQSNKRFIGIDVPTLFPMRAHEAGWLFQIFEFARSP